jgi:hypothetical protein
MARMDDPKETRFKAMSWDEKEQSWNKRFKRPSGQEKK